MRLSMYLVKVKSVAQCFCALSKKDAFSPGHVHLYLSVSSYKSISHPAFRLSGFHFPDATSCLLTLYLTLRIYGLGRIASQDSNPFAAHFV